jgi:hypothetical protein
LRGESGELRYRLSAFCFIRGVRVVRGIREIQNAKLKNLSTQKLLSTIYYLLTTLCRKKFSVLILLRRLFLLLARHSMQASSALASCVGSVFLLQAKTEKLKSFPFYAFRFPFFTIFAILI